MRAKFVHKALMMIGVAILICGFSMQASAIPFNQNTGFDTTPGTLLSVDPVTPQNDIRWNTTTPALPGDLPAGYSIVSPSSPYFNTITWGGASPYNGSGGLGSSHWGNSAYSGLRVLGFAGDAPVDTWTTISRIYHQNNAIPIAVYALDSAIVYSKLTVGSVDINPIPITFNETYNGGTCAGPSGLGICPDEWTFNASGFAPVFFTFPYPSGGTYRADFQLANFDNSVLDDSNSPYWSLWTKENDLSSADVQMKLTYVPEPATLALLGLGLLGIGIVARRRKS